MAYRYDGYDGYESGRPPRMAAQPELFLNIGGQGLHRARSHGHGARPVPPNSNGDELPPDPRGRRVNYVPVDARPVRSRSRSDYGRRDDDPYVWDMQNRLAEAKRRDESAERRRIRRDAVAEAKREQEEEEERMKSEIEKREAARESKRLKAIEDEKEMIRRLKEKDKAEKEKKESEFKEFERLQKARKEEEEARKKKADDEYKERVRKDFAKFGLSENQIEHMVDPKKIEQDRRLGPSGRYSHEMTISQHRRSSSGLSRPVYPKIKRKDIEIATLTYYDLPWEYEKGNENSIIILHELDERETDILFEHSRRLRSRKVVAIEERGSKDNPSYAWVRRRSKSRGKSPARRERITETYIA